MTSRKARTDASKPALSPTTDRAQDVPSDPLRFEVEGLVYHLDRAPSKSGRKVVLSVRLAEETGPPLTDVSNLYSFRARHQLAVLVADHFGRQTAHIMGHLAALLDQVERSASARETTRQVVLTEPRRVAALKLLRASDLLDRAAKALDGLGYVGEESTKRLAYLVATSRLLARPLSAILMAPSGAGKSDLLDRLTQLLPQESVEFLSRVSPAALYYAGADHLRHKVVIVDEQAGASEADYAVRTLQTKGYLRLAIPVKGKTESFEARGPIALLSGTTRTDLNPENLSRCLELPLDDSPEQTRRIQEAQRRAWTGTQSKPVPVEAWQDAQRLLEPLEVLIPFATRLDYPARTTKDRRDHQKLLTLIAAHALLYQLQRERDEAGRVIATVADYRVIHDLVHDLVTNDLEGLSSRAAALYRVLASGERPHVTRRDAAALLGTSYMSAKRALDELLAQELVQSAGRGHPRHYRLVDTSLLGPGATLTPPEALERK